MRESEGEGQAPCSFLLGEPEESLRDRWPFPWPVRNAWDLDIAETKGRAFWVCEPEPAVWKHSCLEGKACEGGWSEAGP